MSALLAQKPNPRTDYEWLERKDCKCNGCGRKYYTFAKYPKCPYCGSEDHNLKYGEVAVYVNQLTGDISTEVIPA